MFTTCHNFSLHHLRVLSAILAFILSRLLTDNQDSMFKAIEALSKRFDSLDANIERKLDLVNVNVKNMSERTTALEMKGMYIYIDFQLGLYCFCFNAANDWSMKETWASLSTKEMQNRKQVWLNDEHFSYLWLLTLSHQSSLMTSFSFTVKPASRGQPRRMAGGCRVRPRKKRCETPILRAKILPIRKWTLRI